MSCTHTVCVQQEHYSNMVIVTEGCYLYKFIFGYFWGATNVMFGSGRTLKKCSKQASHETCENMIYDLYNNGNVFRIVVV